MPVWKLLISTEKTLCYSDGEPIMVNQMSSSNLPSRGLMRKFGAIPDGVKPHPGFREEIAK